ncbi:TPA: L,D-transpeptidase family protein [Legionella pneumophila]|nr:L,D-transpeptidase family protein [Legionella pneumophila]HEI6765355.1 L,D-transpeptidase family protein [Legionella pneumophila]
MLAYLYENKSNFFHDRYFFPVTLFASNTTCPLSNGINVLTKKRILNICKNGTVVKTFKVALGYKGVGKKKAGDNKTPIGLYGLAHPRKSNQFKVFIPILYPTKKQLAAGYTGRDVGIHGPTQSPGVFSWLNNLPGSTRGCVAVGKNNYIEYVANWVKANPGAKVLII